MLFLLFCLHMLLGLPAGTFLRFRPSRFFFFFLDYGTSRQDGRFQLFHPLLVPFYVCSYALLVADIVFKAGLQSLQFGLECLEGASHNQKTVSGTAKKEKLG